MSATLTRPAGTRSRTVRRSARPPAGARLFPKALHFLTFGAPGLLAFLVFVLIPIGMTVWTGFTNRTPANPPTRQRDGSAWRSTHTCSRTPTSPGR